MPIILTELLGPYAAQPWSPGELATAEHLLVASNSLAVSAEDHGVVLRVNPATKTFIGGTGNGGARPKGSKVGAPGSLHQLLMALDWYDPDRSLMRWLLSYGLETAQTLGLYFEHPQWTRSWVHMQIAAPGDGLTRWNLFFLPYRDMEANPTTCAALLEQDLAAVPALAYSPRS